MHHNQNCFDMNIEKTNARIGYCMKMYNEILDVTRLDEYEKKDWRIAVALIEQVKFKTNIYVDGVVYRITLEDGHFYIGRTTRFLVVRIIDHLKQSFRSWETDKKMYRILEEKLMQGETIEVDVLSNDVSQEGAIIKSYHDSGLILNKQFIYNYKGEKLF